MCSLCKSHRATAECLNCNIELCRQCAEKHKQNERLKSHLIKDYKDMMLVQPSSASPSPQKVRSSVDTLKSNKLVKNPRK